MKFDALAPLLRDCQCQVFGYDEGMNEAEIEVLAALIRAFDEPMVHILCEPSIARSDCAPDLVVLHPRFGVLVIEVKGHHLDQIEGHVGGEFQVREQGRSRTIHPRKQARRAMFDLKNAADGHGQTSTPVPFNYRATFANITRAAWERKWEGHGPDPAELWFRDDLEPESLRYAAESAASGRPPFAEADLDQVRRALGDTSLLYDERREVRTPPYGPGTLGALFDLLAVDEKRLSTEQRELTSHDWHGPRLTRGVAGSGKTIVLAMQVARRVASHTRQGELFARPLRVLAVCFNRSLVPYVEEKIRSAYLKRTGGEALPAGIVQVSHLNGLYYQLSTHRNAAGVTGLWPYLGMDDGTDESRAARYLAALEATLAREPSRLELHRFDAIYVDEGQDFHGDEYRLLARLCTAPTPNSEPSLFIFYDDAQNVYGRRRPTWAHLGLNVRGGRSTVMKHCFRNTHPIVESAFNVLLGAAAPDESRVQTATFADRGQLEEDGVLTRDGRWWSVHFAERQGPPPELFVDGSPQREAEHLAERVHWLLVEQQVRPEDVLVLGARKERLREIAAAVRRRLPNAVPRLAFDDANRSDLLFRPGQVTFSTIQSAKGYDAFYVLLASANHLATTSEGRATFYVACTRAAGRVRPRADGAGGGAVDGAPTQVAIQ
jgi:AAA domain/Nuclease-related domain